MNPLLRRFFRTLSLLLTAFFLACIVWVIAINTTDPLEKRLYPAAVPLEIVGLDQNLMIVNPMPQSVNIVLSAPKSVWANMLGSQQVVRAVLDFTNLKAGQYDLEIQIQIDAQPIRVDYFAPRSVNVIITAVDSQPIK